MKKTLLYLTLAALGIAGATATFETLNPEPKQKIKNQRTLEQITFKQVQLNPSLGQQYLDQILKDKEIYRDYLWDSFERLVYDPNFKKVKEYSPELKEPSESALAITIQSARFKGKKQPSFFCKKCFTNSFIKTEEDLLSCIDNESAHAYIIETHKLPNYLYEDGHTYTRTGKESYKVNILCMELISYDTQCRNIATGKRKVSNIFMNCTKSGYLKKYSELQEISKQNNEDSRLAKVILKILKYVPKKK